MIKVEGKQVQIEGSIKDLKNEAVRAIVAVTESYYELKVHEGKTEEANFAAADLASEILDKGTIAVINRLQEKDNETTSEEEAGCVPEL